MPVRVKPSGKYLTMVDDSFTGLWRFLDKNGDGTGDKNANEDYSGTGLGATTFKITPSNNRSYLIARMIVSIEDSGTFQAQGYGALAALTNGITVQKWRDGALDEDLLDGTTIKTNGQWGIACYDVDLKTWGAGDSLLLVRWTFERSGYPIILDASHNEELRVTLNDNLSGLIEHRFKVQGIY